MLIFNSFNYKWYFFIYSIHTPEIERSYTIDESDSIYFQTEMESYKPIQPVIHDHGVCTFPITPACSRLNSHLLQACRYF